jgi:hypothetical protein
MADPMPKKELELITKAKAVQTYATANLAAIGLAAADLTPFTNRITAADTGMAGYQTAKTNTSVALAAKNTGMSDLQKEWRALRRKLNGNANLSNAQREGLGLPVAGQSGMAMAVALSFTRPLVNVVNSVRLKQVINFSEASTPASKARPRGVAGAEVWMVVLGKDVAPPRDTLTMKMLGQAAASPYEMTFTAEDAGKIAWYQLRWVDTASKPGGWSELAGAMIVA